MQNTGQEFDGSDSGARPDEAVSWGKIRAGSESVKVGLARHISVTHAYCRYVDICGRHPRVPTTRCCYVCTGCERKTVVHQNSINQCMIPVHTESQLGFSVSESLAIDRCFLNDSEYEGQVRMKIIDLLTVSHISASYFKA